MPQTQGILRREKHKIKMNKENGKQSQHYIKSFSVKILKLFNYYLEITLSKSVKKSFKKLTHFKSIIIQLHPSCLHT